MISVSPVCKPIVELALPSVMIALSVDGQINAVSSCTCFIWNWGWDFPHIHQGLLDKREVCSHATSQLSTVR